MNKLERGAERVRSKNSLPKSYSKGAKEAFANFIKFYGKDDGKRIFVQKAIEKGRGETIAQRINTTYKSGAKLRGS